MSREAMKLALEALEWCHGGEPCGTAEAITALREALAKSRSDVEQPSGGATLAPVQQCMDHGECFGGKCIHPAPQPAQQEPVAEVKAKMTGGNVGIATVIHEIYSPMRHPLVPGDLLYECPVNQAPVGWMHSRTGLFYSLGVKPDESGLLDEPTDKALPIYTSPPAQRTWVGLTDEEREQHRNDWHSNIHDKEFRAIEAKLKEKNT